MSPAGDGKSTAVLAVDTGGTFTDLILLHDGGLKSLKVPSTPEDPSAAVLAGITQILGDPPDPYRLIHGSTVATNALLERKGARVLLVTNAGFEDVIEIGRQDRPQLYALTGHRPPPLVARVDRVGVRGRLDPDGGEIAPVDPDELAELPRKLAEAEAVAVVLLHSYANPAHEEAVASALASLGVPVSLSSRILPEFREFERTATTVVNAYVAPRVEGYLSRLARESGATQIRIMGSNGGALPVQRAIAEPVHTILSGPAGGVVGAMEWGRRSGIHRLLSFDMGGTSTDVSLVAGEPLHTREGRVGDVPVAIPLLDIHTVGAGGGSIASIDAGGALRVGPGSAGAHPGPVAYGRGGEQITVTDAHVWLGRLPTNVFLGGRRRLDREAIADPLQRLASRAGTDPDALAEGVLTVVDAAMERALRVISVERGVDPSDFHLVAFGGAAGLHAAELTERLGLQGALIPPDPGLLSAFGMLVAPVVRDRSRTVLVSSGDAGTTKLVRSVLDGLEAEGRREMVGEGADPSALSVDRWVDARYGGQSYELRVVADDWVAAFHDAHDQRYGYRRKGPVEAVTVRVRIQAPGEEIRTQPLELERPTPPSTPATEEPVFGGSTGQEEIPGHETDVVVAGARVVARIVERARLTPGSRLLGPAIVSEYSATTWCPPGWEIAVDPRGSLHLTRMSEPLSDSEGTPMA